MNVHPRRTICNVWLANAESGGIKAVIASASHAASGAIARCDKSLWGRYIHKYLLDLGRRADTDLSEECKVMLKVLLERVSTAY